MSNGIKIRPFVWRITYSHVIAYFLAGIFALAFMNYKEHFASGSLSNFMKPVDSAIVALGPALQIIRGIIIAIALIPLRKSFIEDKTGIFKLALLIFGISFISTIGPAPGSFEGFIYTTLPLQYQFLGIPETLIYIFLFCSILWISYKIEKIWIFILSIILVVVICILSILGYLSASGLISQT